MSYLGSLQWNFPHLEARRGTLRNAAAAPEDTLTDLDPVLAKLIRWQPLPEGREGTLKTLHVMAELARAAAHDPGFIGFVEAHFLDAPLDAVDSYYRAFYRYRDEQEETVRTPQFMVADLARIGHLEGDCDDIATLYAATFAVLGYPARFVAIRYRSDVFEHVFVEANVNGTWRRFDATVRQGQPMIALESLIVQV
jgi:transglutaminase-like putative cysteine protease